MTVYTLTPPVEAFLESVAGETPDEKVLSLLETYLATQLRACEREINEFEVKYHSTFNEFVEAWKQNLIPNKHSHEIERDYMEWEGLVAEKKRWLDQLRSLSELSSPTP